MGNGVGMTGNYAVFLGSLDIAVVSDEELWRLLTVRSVQGVETPWCCSHTFTTDLRLTQRESPLLNATFLSCKLELLE